MGLHLLQAQGIFYVLDTKVALFKEKVALGLHISINKKQSYEYVYMIGCKVQEKGCIMVALRLQYKMKLKYIGCIWVYDRLQSTGKRLHWGCIKVALRLH